MAKNDKKEIDPYILYLVEEARNNTGWMYTAIGLISWYGATQASSENFGGSNWQVIIFCIFVASLVFLLFNMWFTVVFAHRKIKEEKRNDCSRCLLKLSFHCSFIFTLVWVLLGSLLLILNYVWR